MSEAEHKTLSPKRSEPDVVAPEQQQQQQLLLHQTTQSLLMASSMLCPAPVHPPPPPPHTQIKFNVEDLLRENTLLHAKLKELSLERDRLLCEVSNLRLELDMSELKRLPLDLDEG
ncbi:hypothetical protein ACLKA6_011548 [Drosophila palustris]